MSVKNSAMTRPIRIATTGSSWAKTVGRPVLETSFATSKTYANKAIQVGIESRMREYGYTTAVGIALDVAGRIRSIHTGGEGQYTQWVHYKLIVGSETIYLAHT